MKQEQRKQLNPEPIGPAHVWHPRGYPTRRIPFSGMYAMVYPSTERFYTRENGRRPWIEDNRLEFEYFRQ